MKRKKNTSLKSCSPKSPLCIVRCYLNLKENKKLTNIRNDITIRLKHKHPLKYFDIVILRFGRPFTVFMDTFQ